MMNLLAQFMGQQTGQIFNFNMSYYVSGAGSSVVNGTYFAMMSPDVKDDWGNPVYLNSNGTSHIRAFSKTGNIYTFKFYNGSNYNWYQWTGEAPQDVHNPTVLAQGSAPFPTIN